ncbi:hypothetical protein [Kingella potus]|uniref:hypothetical protein n=1 Tax=Kingella potus TaxID=265175 RepID=UPI00155860BD|nr:hypothetical protein [Kingella potus]UOP00980.1 hypothetical protein LVJ84_00790 [Kingella potus]
MRRLGGTPYPNGNIARAGYSIAESAVGCVAQPRTRSRQSENRPSEKSVSNSLCR